MHFLTKLKCKLDESPHTMNHVHISRVIAGNHDLTLDDQFCTQNPERKYFGVEDVLNVDVRLITFVVPLTANDNTQTRREIKNMLKGPRAKGAGIVYLENEEHTFQIKEGRRKWSVYGSPVSLYLAHIMLDI